jgi:hypothetical protein
MDNSELTQPFVADLTSGAVFEVDFERSAQSVLVWDGEKAWSIPRDYFAQRVRTGDFCVAHDADLRPPQR